MGRIEVFNKFKRLTMHLEYRLYGKFTTMDYHSKDFYFELIAIKRLILDIYFELVLMDNFHYNSFEMSEIKKLKCQFKNLKYNFHVIEDLYRNLMGEALYDSLILQDL